MRRRTQGCSATCMCSLRYACDHMGRGLSPFLLFGTFSKISNLNLVYRYIPISINIFTSHFLTEKQLTAWLLLLFYGLNGANKKAVAQSYG